MHVLVTQSILEVRQGRRDEGYPDVLVFRAGCPMACEVAAPVGSERQAQAQMFPKRKHASCRKVAGRLPEGARKGKHYFAPRGPMASATTGVTRLRNWSVTGLRDRSSSRRNWTQKLGSVTECQKRRVPEGPGRFPEAFLEGL